MTAVPGVMVHGRLSRLQESSAAQLLTYGMMTTHLKLLSEGSMSMEMDNIAVE